MLISFIVESQNLHNNPNAASVQNETNATTGWTGNAIITSDATDSQLGIYSLRIESSGSNGRNAQYTFQAVVGEQYTITIWVKEGAQSASDPAFAGWTGFQDFSLTRINAPNWTEFTWAVTATNTSPLIKVFSGSARNSSPGDHIFIDNISIIPASGGDSEAPSAVTTVAASNTTTTTTDLSWTASTDNIGVTNYEVFQDGLSIGFTGGATTFNVTGLSADTGYAFTVFARDAVGNISASGNTANITTLGDTEAPSAVTTLAASNTTATTTDLSWTASTDNIGVTDYEVFQDGLSLGFTGGVTTFNVTGLTASTSYAFTVLARDAVPNVSLAGNTINVVTSGAPDTEAPSSVTTVAGSNTTTTTTDLSWTASTDNVGVTNYEVFQDGLSIGLTGGATTFNVTGLSANTGYAFTVFARDAFGNISAPGNTENVTTLADTQAPTAPTSVVGSNTTTTSTDLSWTASTDNIGVTDYEVFQDGLSIGLTGGATSLNVAGLTVSTSYAFTVFARDAVPNVSLVSNTANVTTLDPGSVTDYTSENANLTTIDWTTRDLFADRNVGIGTTNTQGYRLAVAGNVVAEEIKVALQGNWPDFVFENNYKLPTLEEVEDHINKNGHLINIPSAKEVEKTGIKLGQMNAKLLQKIEELTLYTLEQQKKIEKLENDNKQIKQLLDRLLIIENQLKDKK